MASPTGDKRTRMFLFLALFRLHGRLNDGADGGGAYKDILLMGEGFGAFCGSISLSCPTHPRRRQMPLVILHLAY